MANGGKYFTILSDFTAAKRWQVLWQRNQKQVVGFSVECRQACWPGKRAGVLSGQAGLLAGRRVVQFVLAFYVVWAGRQGGRQARNAICMYF